MSQSAKHIFRTRNSAKVIEYVREQEITLTDGDSWEDAIPAGAYDVRCSGLITETITGSGGMANVDVGIAGGDADVFANNQALTAGTDFGPVDQTAAVATPIGSDSDIKVTPDAGSFTAGKIRVCVTYRLMTPPVR